MAGAASGAAILNVDGAILKVDAAILKGDPTIAVVGALTAGLTVQDRQEHDLFFD
jgi:ABC-type transport system involved in cytochrome c biogenesis permease component